MSTKNITKTTKTKKENKNPKFTKEQLLRSEKYANYQDALSALLKDGKTYTHEEVERILKEFYEG